jgi:biotin/methionine sulfoxide reductase
MGDLGSPSASVPLPMMPAPRNPVRSFIPVARIADLLLKPGESFDYAERVTPIPTSAWCTGRAAIRSITTRI